MAKCNTANSRVFVVSMLDPYIFMEKERKECGTLEKRIYDQTCPVSSDRTLGVQRPVEYSKVPVRD